MSNQALINIAFQLFGALLSLMILLFLLFVRKNKNRIERLYIRFLACNTVALFFNAASWLFDGWPGTVGRWGAVISNFFIFFLSYLLLGLFAEYVAGYLTERGAHCHGNKIVWCFCAVSILLIVISQRRQYENHFRRR